MFTTSQSHPFGVLPSGNKYLYASNDGLLSVRSDGLGRTLLARLSDENIIEILSFLPHDTLVAVTICSRALYVFSNHFELWRDLVLRYWPDSLLEYHVTWKDTFIQTWLTNRTKYYKLHTNAYPLTKPIRVKGIFSDLLYRSWSCYSFDVETSCPGFTKFTDIKVIDNPHEMTLEEFYTKFERPRVPVILKNAVGHWPACSKWTKEYLIQKCGDMKFRATSATAPLGAHFTMKQYFKYADEAQEEAPLYLFERDFINSKTKLNEDYDIHPFFAPKPYEILSDKSVFATDLFQVFGDVRRPDYRWFIAGPKRSGSLFHIDPNGTHAWNCSIQGRKKWIFYPPNVPPPGIESSPDGADVAVPISNGEWMLTFWKYHLKERKNPDISKRPLEGICYPGDVIFVPAGYWHMVFNLDDCIALTQNYVSTSNLTSCLQFLREVRIYQVSNVVGI